MMHPGPHGWIGLRDRETVAWNPVGLRAAEPARLPRADTPLPRGTLLIECTFDPDRLSVPLLDYHATAPWPSGLRLAFDRDGTLHLTMRQGIATTRSSLHTTLTRYDGAVIVSLGWDGPARRGYLSVFCPASGDLAQTEVIAPPPLTHRDGRRLVGDSSRSEASPDLHYLALSDRLEPAGPMPGLSPGAQIETPTGPVPLSALGPGDIVSTASGDIAVVRWCDSLDLPARGRYAPLLLRAPYHGLTEDLLVAPDQRLCLTGSDVEYLFATDRVSAAAGTLVDHRAVLAAPRQLVMTYRQVVLDRPAVLLASGAMIESQDLAPLLAAPQAFASSAFADLPPELRPRTAKGPCPVLQDYEAWTLGHHRAA